MSVEAIAIALHHSRAKGTAKLVLIGIANHDGDGGAWPSIDTLSIYAGVDVRNVQRAIDQLERLGEVRRLIQGGGTSRTPEWRRPNLYEVRLQCPPDCDRTKNHRTKRRPKPLQLQLPADSDADLLSTGVALAPPVQLSTGVADSPPGGVAPAPPEPSQEATTDTSRDLLQTARAYAAAAGTATLQRCVDGSLDHEYSRRYGSCVYCGGKRP